VVTSNGMHWCWENTDTSQGNLVFAGKGLESTRGRDFALLTRCNYTIMTIGTQGLWTAYLAVLPGQLHPARLPVLKDL
jgi:galactoside 2-L-fucosyltransferase 1/2